MAQIKTGTVTSNKMQKTVTVKVVSKVKHPFYKKIITQTKTFKTHDELGAQVGQKVKIAEIRPVSKDVYFKVLEVLK